MEYPNIQFAPNIGNVVISSANTQLDGSGNITSLITANGDGTVVNSIVVKAMAQTSQGMIRIFLSNGPSYYLIQEVMIPAIVPSGVVEAYSTTVFLLLNLSSGYSLGVTTQNSESFSITAAGMNYTNCNC